MSPFQLPCDFWKATRWITASQKRTQPSVSWFKILLNTSKVFSTLPSDPWLGPESLIITRFQMERHHQTLSGFILLKTQGNVDNIFPICWFTVQIWEGINIRRNMTWNKRHLKKKKLLMTLRRVVCCIQHALNLWGLRCIDFEHWESKEDFKASVVSLIFFRHHTHTHPWRERVLSVPTHLWHCQNYFCSQHIKGSIITNGSKQTPDNL